MIIYAAVSAQASRLSVPFYTNSVYFKHTCSERSCHCGYEVDAFDSSLIGKSECAYHLPVFSYFPMARWWNDQVSRLLSKTRRLRFTEQSFTHDMGLLRDIGLRTCSTSPWHGDIETNAMLNLGANDQKNRQYARHTDLPDFMGHRRRKRAAVLDWGNVGLYGPF